MDPAADDPSHLRPGSDGRPLTRPDFLPDGGIDAQVGIYSLAQVDLFNILCIPPFARDGLDSALIEASAAFCEKRRAMLLIDAPPAWRDAETAVAGLNALGLSSRNAALYFPALRYSDEHHGGGPEVFPPCGAVAGVYAKTDAERGVWKAPAGTEATLVDVNGLSLTLDQADANDLNLRGINCVRQFSSVGPVIWGARTLGDDEYEYIPVRRSALFIEGSILSGTKWAVFEPNGGQLWSQLCRSVTDFLQTLWMQGAFQGTKAEQAYFVKCDAETTTRADMDLGIVNIVVGFAPLRPAEFVIINIQQMAGECLECAR